MNRRSFITKVVAGLAAVPLLGKLAQTQQYTLWDEIEALRAANKGMSVEEAQNILHANWMVYHEAALRLGCTPSDLTHLPIAALATAVSSSRKP
jgi:hypothetical protein